jgi:prepilin peptidase CpaA
VATDPEALIRTGGCLLLVLSAISDTRYRKIPQWSVICLALLGTVRLWIAPEGEGNAWADAGVTALMFGLGALAFVLGTLGGGDVKLAAAVCLWLGWTDVPAFFAITSLCGGALAGGILIGRKLPIGSGTPGRQLKSVPYGVAIATGGVIAAFL